MVSLLLAFILTDFPKTFKLQLSHSLLGWIIVSTKKLKRTKHQHTVYESHSHCAYDTFKLFRR